MHELRLACLSAKFKRAVGRPLAARSFPIYRTFLHGARSCQEWKAR